MDGLTETMRSYAMGVNDDEKKGLAFDKSWSSLVDVYDVDTAHSWMFGQNSYFDDNAPIWVLRYGNHRDMFNVINAAQSFAAGY